MVFLIHLTKDKTAKIAQEIARNRPKSRPGWFIGQHGQTIYAPILPYLWLNMGGITMKIEENIWKIDILHLCLNIIVIFETFACPVMF